MKKFLALAVLISSAGLFPAFAQTRVATVDLMQVINHYYKADQVFGQLSEEQKVYQNSLSQMQQNLQKEETEYEQLVKAIKDPSVSQEARAQKEEQARGKEVEIQQIQEQLQTKYKNDAQSLQNDRSIAEQQLVEDVSKAASQIAASKGYDLVLDKSGTSLASNSPMVFYTSPAVPDITIEVTTRLNANAPHGAAPVPAASATH